MMTTLLVVFVGIPLGVGALWMWARQTPPPPAEEGPVARIQRKIREAHAQTPMNDPEKLRVFEARLKADREIQEALRAKRKVEALLAGVESRVAATLGKIFRGEIVIPIEKVPLPRRQEAESRFVGALAESIAKDLDPAEGVRAVCEEFIR